MILAITFLSEMFRTLTGSTSLCFILAGGWFSLAVLFILVSSIRYNMDPAMMPSMGPMKMGCLDTSMMDVSMACMMNMDMTFHSGTCECLLFQNWLVRDGVDYFIFSIVLFIVCALRDGFAIGAEMLLQKSKNSFGVERMSWMASLIDMGLYGGLVCIEYGLMLVIMSYNFGLFCVIIAGLMVSRFIFYPMTIKGGAAPTTCH